MLGGSRNDVYCALGLVPPVAVGACAAVAAAAAGGDVARCWGVREARRRSTESSSASACSSIVGCGARPKQVSALRQRMSSRWRLERAGAVLTRWPICCSPSGKG